MPRLRKINQGFGLVQTLISLAITSVLGLGAYKVLKSVGSSTQQTSQKTSRSMEMDALLRDLTRDLNNAIPFPLDSKSKSEAVLMNFEPDRCKGTSPASLGYPSGLIPLPFHTVASLNTENNSFTELDPSELPGEMNATQLNATSDAVQFVYRLVDSVAYEVERVTPSDKLSVPRPTKGAQPIYVSKDAKLFPGDFFIISDLYGAALGRVTNRIDVDSDTVKLEKSTSSIWNGIWTNDLSRDYGRIDSSTALEGGAKVERVGVSTIAYDPTTREIKRDKHIQDDGYNPISSNFGAQPVLAREWQTVLKDVDKLQFYYHVQPDCETGSTCPDKIRNPRAGAYGEANAGNSNYCGNQIGLPLLKFVEVKITQGTDETARAVNMESMKMGVAASGDDIVKFGGDQIIITELSIPTSPVGGGGSGACNAPCGGEGSY